METSSPQPSGLQGILLGSLTLQVPQMIVMVGQGFSKMVREGLLGQRLKKQGGVEVGGQGMSP